MYVGMNKIDIYNDSAIIQNQKTPKKIISWITILIILFIVFLIISFIPFNIYKSLIGQVVNIENEYYIVVKECDFPLNKNNKLYIKEKNYKYEIVKIDEEILLKINLEDGLKIENNIVYINILSERTNVFNILKNKIKKGFGL